MIDVTIAVCTFGDREWITLATERAIPSAQKQNVRVFHKHGHSLDDARNKALEAVTTEFVIFLDADDELEPGYVEAMSKAQGDVRVPLVAYVRNGRRRQPYMPTVAGHRHVCTAECLVDGNWIVIGAAVRTDLLKRVGGWRDFPWSEDWDAWLRCHMAGADFQAAPGAVYRAHVRPDSRNRAPDAASKLAAHRAIYAANFPEQAAA